MPEQQNQPNANAVKIPQFMTEEPQVETPAEDSIRKDAGKLYKLMLGISSVWFLVVIIYITQFFGWSNLFLMMPDEFGGFLAGVTLPLAIIWMVIAYIDRGASFKQEAKLLHAYMNQLVYPEDGAAQTSKAMTDAIRAQVLELRQATKQATEETDRIKTELGQHVADFSKLVSVLQGYSGTTMNELNDGMKLMSQGLDYINDKVNTTANVIEKRITDFSATANTVKTEMEQVTGTLKQQLENIQSASGELNKMYSGQNQIVTMNSELLNKCSSKLNNDFDSISSFINTQSARLEKLSAGIVSSYQDIYKQLQEKSVNVEKTFANQSGQILDYLKNLDKTSVLAAGKFEEFRSNLNKEVEAIISRTKTISDCVDMKVQDLTGLADTIHQSMNDVDAHMADKLQHLQDISQAAVTNVVSAAETFDDKMKSLHQEQLSSVETTKALCLELEDRSNSMSATALNVESVIDRVCEKMQTNVGNAKSTANMLVDSVKEAETLITRQSDSLQKISDTLSTQGQLNTSVMEQQNKLLSAALVKIENSKDTLKQQMDDLLRMANSIDDETVNAVKRMNGELENSLKQSSEVIGRANGATQELQTQTQQFALLSDQALAKVGDFSSTLRDNQSSLETLVQNIVSRAENVASILEAQIKAVNGATDNTTNKHNKLLELFNQQSSILNSTAENTAHYVADMVQALDEKAATINLLFKNQQSEFFNICDKLSENTGAINDTLKNQIMMLEQSSDRVFNRMAGFEEEFSKKALLLNNTSNQTIDKLLNVNNILNQQNQEVEDSVTVIGGKIKAVSEELNKTLGGFNNYLQAIKEESSAAGSEINASCNRLKESGRTLLADSRNIAQILESQVKSLDGSLTKIKSQSEQISGSFNKQKDSIADVVNLVSTQTRLGEASLAQQYKYLSDAANDVSAKMKEIETLFQNNTAGVFDTSSKLAFEINALSDRIIKAGEDVNKVSKQSVSSIESAGMSLNNLSDTLTETVNNTNKRVDGVITKYQDYVAGFNTVTAEASSGVVEVNNLISQQNDKMIKISEDTKHLVESFNVVLNEASNQLAKRAGSAFEQIKNIGAQLKELSLQLEDSTQLTAKHMSNAGDKMRASINEIAANAERISNDIRSSGEVFLKQSGVLSGITEDTLHKVNEAMDALKNGSEDLSVKGKMWLEQSDEFTKVFERQAEIIDTTSLKAAENLRKLETKYQEVQVDSFLKDAATLFERMETVAIDINRIFNPTTEEEIWKKYYSGDTSAFVRYLAKVMTKNQIGAIRKEYEENADFRSLVNRYVADFEMLISKAKGNERAGVLLSVISGSDVGKVYYVIAKALDKLN